MAIRDNRNVRVCEPDLELTARLRQRPLDAEIERRSQLFEQARQLRERIGPIAIRADELKHMAREASEGID